jgi:4-hydroxythreonine-4-phosphate dehydrogenase
MPASSCIRLAITMGDPAGIGPEICVRALDPEALPVGVTPILIGDAALLAQTAPQVLRAAIPVTVEIGPAGLKDGALHLCDIGAGGESAQPGRASAHGGRASAAYLQAAVNLALAGRVDGIVTAPISKDAWRLAGIRHPGHTEFLREAVGSSRTAMLFVGGGLMVALFTTHVSIAEARAALATGSLVDFIEFVVAELHRYGMTGLRVAVAGFNPHAGESGLFGDEELRKVAPAVEECRRRGLEVAGPFPADTLFSPPTRRRYDLAVALYHDQGLIPVKALAFGSAVNVTLGLPFVRTSPPHGVAYDIVGRGKASAEGMIAAIEMAANLAGRSVRE